MAIDNIEAAGSVPSDQVGTLARATEPMQLKPPFGVPTYFHVDGEQSSRMFTNQPVPTGRCWTDRGIVQQLVISSHVVKYCARSLYYESER